MSDPVEIGPEDQVGEPEHFPIFKCFVYTFPDGEIATSPHGARPRWELLNHKTKERQEFWTFDDLIAFRQARRAFFKNLEEKVRAKEEHTQRSVRPGDADA